MKAMAWAIGATGPLLMLALGLVITTRGEAAAPSLSPAAVTESLPHATPGANPVLSQVENVPERVATARVSDSHGKVVGAVQRVEMQNGRPTRVQIALMGSANLISLDAATLRYDAAVNMVVTGESVAQLLARAAI